MMMNNMRKQILESNKNETENNKEDQGSDVEETKEIPEFTTEELQAAINRLKKKANQETATESEPKTSKHATKNERNGETDLQRSAKTKRLHTRGMAKNK